MRKIPFCNDWTFRKEEAPAVTRITLPHDATILEKRRPDAPSGSAGAYFPGGSYLYEKTFLLPEETAVPGNDTFLVQFEGVYPTAEVYLNRQQIGSIHYGYTEYTFPLTGLCPGEENTLRVKVDHTALPDSRWYAGAGIYRPVWLYAGSRAHIVPDGIRVTTLSLDPPVLRIETEHTAPECSVRLEIYEKTSRGRCGRLVAAVSSDGSLASSRPAAPAAATLSDDASKAPAAADNAEATAALCLSCTPDDSLKGTSPEHAPEASISRVELSLPGAKLWDADHPYLYLCRACLMDGNTVIDSAETTFGIRTLSWSNEGFFVNGQNVLLRGGCIHYDNGILGARTYPEAEYRRIRILKEGGFNAIRSAHNPLCRHALEACDALGMYVLDEAWDMWDKHKMTHDYADRFPAHYEEDLAAMVRKDYSHPCVVMYSIGNEVTEPARLEGVALAARLVAVLKKQDATRPVTAGLNLTLLLLASWENNPQQESEKGDRPVPPRPSPEGMNSTEYNRLVSERGNRMTLAAATPAADAVSSPVLSLLDIQGYNYASSRYEQEGALHPERILVGAESYTYDLKRNWDMVERLPWLIGDFMWSAWDYLGEAGIGAWSYAPEDAGFSKSYPWLLADTGAYDILGDDNAAAGRAAVIWNPSRPPYIGIRPVNHPGIEPYRAQWRDTNALPRWSYQGCEGNPATIEVFTGASFIELYLNDHFLGREAVREYRAVFQTVYEPGELKAVAYDENGQVCGESSLRSADAHTRITITPEGEAVRGGLLYVHIDLTGANGILECNRDTLLTLSVQGAGLLAFGSANPKTEETFNSHRHKTYYGRSMAVLRVEASEIILSVSGQGLQTATRSIATLSPRYLTAGHSD